MALQSSWVDQIIAKLAVRYGAAFQRLYADIDPAAVKADWAEVLDGFERHPDALRYALENLPETPPNAAQFRSIARRAPAPVVAALAAPGPAERPPPELAHLARRLTGPRPSPAQQCVDRIEQIVSNRGGSISPAQRHIVAHCLRVPGVTTRLDVHRAGAVADAEAVLA